MTKQEIISKWEKELSYSNEKAKKYHFEGKPLDHDKWSQNVVIISSMLADLKKLNEAIVSECEFCDCGNEHSMHQVENNTCSNCERKIMP